VTRDALQAERARRDRLAVTLEQRREMKRLSLAAGVPMPHVYSMSEAADEIQKLQGMCGGQPQLEGFGAVGGR